jgi:DNA invertase Pin-like site-specific DNA recombinase
LTEAIDTTTPAGRMMMQMVGAFADYAKRAIMQSDSAEVALWRAFRGFGTPQYNRGLC